MRLKQLDYIFKTIKINYYRKGCLFYFNSYYKIDVVEQYNYLHTKINNIIFDCISKLTSVWRFKYFKKELFSFNTEWNFTYYFILLSVIFQNIQIFFEKSNKIRCKGYIFLVQLMNIFNPVFFCFKSHCGTKLVLCVNWWRRRFIRYKIIFSYIYFNFYLTYVYLKILWFYLLIYFALNFNHWCILWYFKHHYDEGKI